jgi:hypothetical protein
MSLPARCSVPRLSKRFHRRGSSNLVECYRRRRPSHRRRGECRVHREICTTTLRAGASPLLPTRVGAIWKVDAEVIAVAGDRSAVATAPFRAACVRRGWSHPPWLGCSPICQPHGDARGASLVGLLAPTCRPGWAATAGARSARRLRCVEVSAKDARVFHVGADGPPVTTGEDALGLIYDAREPGTDWIADDVVAPARTAATGAGWRRTRRRATRPRACGCRRRHRPASQSPVAPSGLNRSIVRADPETPEAVAQRGM